MDTAQKAGIALVVLILIKVVILMIRFYSRQKPTYPKASIILVVGAHLSKKSEIVRIRNSHAFPCISQVSCLQSKLCNSRRLFIRSSFNEIIERLPSSVLPTSHRASDHEIGDDLFDAWTFSEKPDGSVDLCLTERGTRAVIGIHKSWVEIVKAGNNLIIDYTFYDAVLFKHLLTQLKSVAGRVLDRLIVVEIEESLSSIQTRHSSTNTDLFPSGFTLSTFKKQKDLRELNMGSAQRCVVKVSDKLDTAIDTAYRFIRRTGLL